MQKSAFQSNCDLSADAIYNSIPIDARLPICDYQDVFQKLVQSVLGGDIWKSKGLLIEIENRLKESSNFEDLSYFSRSFVKRLALHRVPSLAESKQESLISISHDLHASLCRYAFQIRPPKPIPDCATKLVKAAVADVIASDERNVILLMVTKGYLENLELWLDCIIRSQQEIPVILLLNLDAASTEVARIFDERNISYVEAPLILESFSKTGNGSSLLFIWYLKVFASLELLRAGVNVIYSDLDSFWLGNVLNEIRLLSWGVDAYFMTADNMPMISHLRYGVTCGCGFFFAVASKNAVGLFEHWLGYTAIMLDDQIGLAQMLMDGKVRWVASKEYNVSSYGDFSIVNHDVKYSIALFSKKFATRTSSVMDVPSLKFRPVLVHPRWVNDVTIRKSDYLEKLFGCSV